jgi:hypothetical protein
MPEHDAERLVAVLSDQISAEVGIDTEWIGIS